MKRPLGGKGKKGRVEREVSLFRNPGVELRNCSLLTSLSLRPDLADCGGLKMTP